MEKLKIIFIIGIIVSLVKIALSCQPEIGVQNIFPTFTPVPPEPTKQIISTNLPLTEIWRWSGQTFELITVTSDEKILVAVSHMWEGDKVIAFDAHTGKIVLESEYVSNLASVHADDKYFYIGTIRFVRAYDLKSGQRIWEGAQQPSFKRGGLYVYSTGDQLEVYDPYDNHRYILDIETGQTITDEYENRHWTYNTGGSGSHWPIIDNIAFMNRDGRLIAINKANAKTIWQSTEANLASRVASDGDLLYAIRDDAAIVGFDPETGEPVGFIEMMPAQAPPTMPADNSGSVYTMYYTVATSDKFIVVYYGNSKELIVFEK